jgi:hypothetical protein
MSSLSGSAASDDEVPERSKVEVKAPETAPSTSRKHGRPKGSRNKSTLEALTAKAATAASTSVAPQATGAPSDTGVPEKRRPGRPKGSGKKTASAAAATPSSPRHRGRPLGSKNKKAPAAFGAIASTSARPRATSTPTVGPSRPWLEKPVLQPPAYILAEGWSTYIIPVLAGARDLLRLPTQFMSLMEDQEMAYAKLREYSGGQPTYRVEVYYDGQGVCYFRDRWSKFFIDYGVHEGWFILLTRHDGKKDFTICLFDDTLSACAFAAQP